MTQTWVILDRSGAVVEEILTASADVHPGEVGIDLTNRTAVMVDRHREPGDEWTGTGWAPHLDKTKEVETDRLHKMARSGDEAMALLFYREELGRYTPGAPGFKKSSYPWIAAVAKAAGVAFDEAVAMVSQYVGNKEDEIRYKMAHIVAGLGTVARATAATEIRGAANRAASKIGLPK